jgi:four helix bundle protein
MSNADRRKPDLEERTLMFAKSVRFFLFRVPKTFISIEDAKQLVRSSGSIGANYIEANERLSDRDFLYRIRICKKEAKETMYWLKLLDYLNDEKLERARKILLQEAKELMLIFGAIVRKGE